MSAFGHHIIETFIHTFFNNPVKIYMFKVKNRSTRNRCENSSKLRVKATERRQ